VTDLAKDWKEFKEIETQYSNTANLVGCYERLVLLMLLFICRHLTERSIMSH
jgi:hypothetical protein